MAKKSKFFTLVIVPNSYGKVRRITIPRFLITVGIIGLVICFFALFYFINEYRIAKEKLTYYGELEKLARVQQEEIASLSEKIAQFNKTLDRLKETENKLKTLIGAGGTGRDIEQSLGEGEPDEYIPFYNSAPEEIKADPLQTINKIKEKLEALKNKSKLRKKNFARLGKLIQERKTLFACTPNIFPVKGWISAGYGIRVNPFTGRKEMHEAIDIVASWGTSVRTACQGKVVYAGWKDFYGLSINIKNEYGYSTVYAHLAKILVKKGQEVKKGEVIGRVGSSGRSTGPHLHFEVWKGGEAVNPLKLMVEPLGSD